MVWNSFKSFPISLCILLSFYFALFPFQGELGVDKKTAYLLGAYVMQVSTSISLDMDRFFKSGELFTLLAFC